MADNVTFTSTSPAGPPNATAVASAEVSFSGDTVQVPIAALAKVSGSEGSRTATLVNPATEDKQDTAIAALASILAKILSAPATEAKQDTTNTKLDTLHTDLATTLAAYVDGLEALVGTSNTGLSSILAKLTADPATQTTLAAILAKLIAAPATEAKQDTANTSLGSIDTKTPVLGQALAAASTPVVLTASQLSTLTPPAAISGFATSAKQDTGNTSAASIDTKTPALGQALSAASSPVVLPAAQITTLTPPAAITGFATSAKQDTAQTALDAIKTDVDKIPSQGQAVAGSSMPVVLPAAQITTLTPPAAITGFATEVTLATRLTESDFDAKIGALTETAPATDTASSGLNGRLQRIAQRISSLITALGSPFQAGGSIGNSAFGATQSGTWTVQPGNTANTTAWKVDGSAVTQPVSIAAAPGLSASVTVTRPSDTTAMAANDVLGPTGGGTSGMDFNLSAVSGSSILITSVSLERDVAALISGETGYILHLYNVTPPSALADNTAFDLPSGDRASYLGLINIGTPVDLGSTLYVEQNGLNKLLKLSGSHVFAYLVTVGAYTPASATVLKVTVNAMQL